MGSTAAKYTEQRRVISGRRAAAATAQEENMEDYNASIDRISSLVLLLKAFFTTTFSLDFFSGRNNEVLFNSPWHIKQVIVKITD